MALLQMNVRAQSLMRTVDVNVILPVDTTVQRGQPQPALAPLRTVYLLHGVYGSQFDWLARTRILTLAEQYALAVVMPAGENSFYVDRAAHNDYYGEFVGQELVALTRRMFPLSTAREDTFLAGLSMGGYGAMRNALKYHDTFGGVISLSGALDIADSIPQEGGGIRSREFLQACFGDLQALPQSDANPQYLLRELVAAGATLPQIYMAIGAQDPLRAGNERFCETLRALQVPHTYVVAEGGHTWEFWDTHIAKALQWVQQTALPQGSAT